MLSSSPRKRGGGFTFEVQQFLEHLRGGCEVKAFSGGVVVGVEEGVEALVGEGGEIGLARNKATHAPDGIFDAALLPGRVGIAEERLEVEPVERTMACELGAVVEGDGAAQVRWQRLEDRQEMFGDGFCGLVGRPGGEQDAALALMHGEHRLTVFGEQHQVGFPMTWGLPIGGGRRPFRYGNAAFDEGRGACALPAAEAAFALAARQIVAPAIILGASHLGIDEAVDALVADHVAAGLAGQTASDLFGGPAAGERLEDGATQVGLPFQARARPAPRARLFLGVTRFVTDVTAAIAPHLARDRRWRAIQSCRDLPDRAATGLKSGNLASVVQ